MIIKRDTENNGFTLIPIGRIDSDGAPDLQRAIDEIIEKCDSLHLEMKETEYISSTGLRVLLYAKKKLGERVLWMTNVNQTIREILDMTGFNDIVEVRESDGDPAKDIKVAFFDIDGTLVSPATGTVPESTVRAFRELRENGVMTVVATGRDIIELMKLPIHDLEFDGYLTLNGNICLDGDRKMFAGNEIDPGEVEVLVQIFNAGRLPFVLIGKEKRYINYVDDVVIKTQMETHGTIPEVGEYNGEKIYQCLAFVDDSVRRKLESLLDQCVITSWNDMGIDIISKTGGKAAGIQKFLDEYGFTRSQVMAFGDGENDISMIKFAGVGVSMGNGVPALKAAADYVTTDVDDNGIENALRHFGLIG